MILVGKDNTTQENTLPSLDSVFPDPARLFAYHPPGLATVQASCDVVLDTNVLLLPYLTGKDSLKQVEKVYSKLASAGRLFVPAQVAREFSRHRASKLAQLCQALANYRSKAQRVVTDEYPLLEALPEYENVKKHEAELADSVKAYQAAVSSLLDAIAGWGWSDPVAAMYQRLFSAQVVWSLACDISDVRQEMAFRYANRIPPGYKDSAKEDGGIGDLLIWKTILEIGEGRRKPLLFVTGDEKSDWQHTADNRGLLPRFELVDEFYGTAGAGFYLCTFSRLLELFGASAEAIGEFKREEDRGRQLSLLQPPETEVAELECPFCGALAFCRIGNEPGSSAKPECPSCGSRFHAHRSKDGTTFARRPRSRQQEDSAVRRPEDRDATVSASVVCPFCAASVDIRIVACAGASAAPVCASCSSWFHAHRRGDGTIIVRKPGDAVRSEPA